VKKYHHGKQQMLRLASKKAGGGPKGQRPSLAALHHPNHLNVRAQVMDDKPAIVSQHGFPASKPVENQGPQGPDLAKIAHLHPPIRKTGVRYTGRYSVTFDGETVVKGSRDPETDLARALLAGCIIGMVMVMDANTKKHRPKRVLMGRAS
jgi:hypothetical protein